MDTNKLATLIKAQQEIQQQIVQVESEARSNLEDLKKLMTGYSVKSDLTVTLDELNGILWRLGYVAADQATTKRRGRPAGASKAVEGTTTGKPRVIRPIKKLLLEYRKLSMHELLDLTAEYQQKSGLTRDQMIELIDELVNEGRLLRKGNDLTLS